MFKFLSKPSVNMAAAFEMAKPQVSVEQQIQEIHNAFNGVGDRLLAEAEAVLAQSVDDKALELADRLSKVGFKSSPVVAKMAEVKDERRLNQEVATLINHYKFYYPQNRFIREADVDRLCEKYNLHFGPVDSYIGSVPVMNLSEIEKFKVREEDMRYFKFYSNMRNSRRQSRTYKDYKEERAEKMMEKEAGGMSLPYLGHFGMYGSTSSSIEPDTQLSICAPLKDFKIDDRSKVVGRRIIEIPDPIVLHPVAGGYLIVTAWGLEAKDESVVNENKN